MHTELLFLLLAATACTGPVNPSDDTASGDTDTDTGTDDTDDTDDTDPETIRPPIVEGAEGEFYADGTVQAIELEISEAGMQALRDHPLIWTEATFVWEGLRYGPVGVRVKGETSFRPIDQKPSLKIKFNEYQADGRFMGLRRLTLNNMVDDASMLRERTAYRVFRELGSPAPRCNHATLTINDMAYGLYSNAENTDEELLQEWYADWEGPMWEIHDADFQPGLDAGFEIEEGDDDRTQINALTDAMLLPDAPVRMFDYVHEDAWWRYFTATAWVGNLDGYPFSEPGDDVHLYLNPTDGLFHFIPHGLDETFRDDAGVEFVMHGILATACLENVACKAEWRTRMAATNAATAPMNVADYVTQVAAEIDAYGDADTKKAYSNSEVDAARTFVHTYAEGRQAYMTEQLTWKSFK